VSSGKPEDPAETARWEAEKRHAPPTLVVNFSLKIRYDLLSALEDRARENGRSVSDMVREAIAALVAPPEVSP
jgi:hypothetical protein